MLRWSCGRVQMTAAFPMQFPHAGNTGVPSAQNLCGVVPECECCSVCLHSKPWLHRNAVYHHDWNDGLNGRHVFVSNVWVMLSWIGQYLLHPCWCRMCGKEKWVYLRIWVWRCFVWTPFCEMIWAWSSISISISVRTSISMWISRTRWRRSVALCEVCNVFIADEWWAVVGGIYMVLCRKVAVYSVMCEANGGHSRDHRNGWSRSHRNAPNFAFFCVNAS